MKVACGWLPLLGSAFVGALIGWALATTFQAIGMPGTVQEEAVADVRNLVARVAGDLDDMARRLSIIDERMSALESFGSASASGVGYTRESSDGAKAMLEQVGIEPYKPDLTVLDPCVQLALLEFGLTPYDRDVADIIRTAGALLRESKARFESRKGPVWQRHLRREIDGDEYRVQIEPLESTYKAERDATIAKLRAALETLRGEGGN